MMRVEIAAFTGDGTVIAEKLLAFFEARGDRASAFGINADGKVQKLAGGVRAFAEHAFLQRADAVIFIGAAGIAVRAVAPYLAGKDKDPAVLVMDDTGRFVIPILSGHIGGANALAAEVAQAFSLQAVITTSTDRHGVFAVDSWAVKNGLNICNVPMIKKVSAALLCGEPVGFFCEFPIEGKLPEGIEPAAGQKAGIAVTKDGADKHFLNTLNLVPAQYAIGIGCRKGTKPAVLEEYVLRIMKEYGIGRPQLMGFASLDLKKQEEAIVILSRKWDLPFQTFSAEQLKKVPGVFTSSDFVRKTTGVDNVCERAAVCFSKGTLILKKCAENGMTIAIAKAEWRCSF